MMSVTGKQRPGEKALTFIELLLVTVIVAALTAISLPNFRSAFDNLELNNFAARLSGLMQYVRERAIVEQKVLFLVIDIQKNECLTQAQDTTTSIKSCVIPKRLSLESETRKVGFYPDGSIDAMALKITNQQGNTLTLTTKGMYGKVSLQKK